MGYPWSDPVLGVAHVGCWNQHGWKWSSSKWGMPKFSGWAHPALWEWWGGGGGLQNLGPPPKPEAPILVLTHLVGSLPAWGWLWLG